MPFDDVLRPIAGVNYAPAAAPSASVRAGREAQPSRSLTFSDIRAMATQDWAASNMARLYSEQGLDYDPDFRLPVPSSAEGKVAWAGIRGEDQEKFFHARSQAHFDQMKRRYQDEMDREAQFAELGGGGLAARFAVNALDPLGVALAVASGPAGWISKGSRMAAFTRAGVLGGATNAALEGAVSSGSFGRDSTDIALAGLFGFGLGGLSGVLLRAGERAAARQALHAVTRRTVAEELVDVAASRGQAISIDDALRTVDRLNAEQGVPVRAPEAAPEPASPRPTASSASEPVAAPRQPQTVADGLLTPTPGAQAAAARIADDIVGTSPTSAAARTGASLSEDIPAPGVAPEAPAAPARPVRKAVERARRARDAAASRYKEAEDEVNRLAQREAAGFEVDPDEIDAANEALTVAGRRLDAAVDRLDDYEAKAGILDGPPEGPTVIPSFGADSAGAARVRSYREVRDTEWIEDIAQKVGMTANQLSDFVKFGGFKIRYDYASVLRGIDDPDLRGTLGLLVSDPVGPKNGVNVTGASEVASRLSKIRRTQYVKAADDAFAAWLKERGTFDIRHAYDPELRMQFMEEAGRAARGIPGDYSPAAQALAGKAKSLLSEIGDALVDVGVLDAKLSNYVPRWANHAAIDEANLKYGSDAIDELYYQGIRRGAWGREIARTLPQEEAEKLLRRVSKGYLQRLREVGREIDVDVMHGVSGQDVDWLARLLREQGVGEDEIVTITTKLKRHMEARGKDDSGRPPLAKHRLSLDESASIRVVDRETYREVEVSIADMLENNLDILMSRYVDVASGREAIARVVGITKDSEFDALVNAAKSRIHDAAKRDQYVKYARDAYDFMVGRPLEADPNSRVARLARNARNLNMARVGSSFGLAQIADLGNVVAVGGWRSLLLGIRDLRKLMAPGPDGLGNAGLVRELRQFTGLGLDHHSTSLWSSEYGELFSTRMGKAELALRGASRAVAVGSGMTKINEWSQLLVGRMIVNKLGSGRISPRRLNYLGLSAEDGEAIAQHLRRMPKDADGNVSTLGLSEMTPGLRERFTVAVRRGASRAIQENDFGATFPFMHSTLGKVVSQFRNFVLVAWTRQTLATANIHDWESFVNLSYALFFGGLSYTAYVAATVPPDKWEERLTPERVAAAAFARSGMSSLLPTGIDTGLGLFGLDPLFAHARSSGLPSNAFAGVPTVELFDRAYKGVRGVAETAAGDSLTQRDVENFRRLVPFQNFFGFGAAVDATYEAFGLPEE